MSSLILNVAQENRIRAVLWTLDSNCAELERLLTTDGGSGLIQIRNDLTSAEVRFLQEKIAQIRQKIRSLAEQLGLKPHIVDVRRHLRATLSLDWSSLIDTLPSKLHRYGNVDDETEALLQPLMSDLLVAIEKVLNFESAGGSSR